MARNWSLLFFSHYIIICLENIILSMKLENIDEKHWISPYFPSMFFFLLSIWNQWDEVNHLLAELWDP